MTNTRELLRALNKLMPEGWEVFRSEAPDYTLETTCAWRAFTLVRNGVSFEVNWLDEWGVEDAPAVVSSWRKVMEAGDTE